MWFLLILVVTLAYNCPSLCKLHTPIASLYLPTKRISRKTEILGGSSPRNVINTRTIRKDCFQKDGASLSHKAPRSRQKGCPNSTIKGLSLQLRKPITLAFLEYNSDFGLCSSAIGPPTN